MANDEVEQAAYACLADANRTIHANMIHIALDDHEERMFPMLEVGPMEDEHLSVLKRVALLDFPGLMVKAHVVGDELHARITLDPRHDDPGGNWVRKP